MFYNTIQRIFNAIICMLASNWRDLTISFYCSKFTTMFYDTKVTIEWTATIICIIASTWRALNLGGQGMSYLASAAGQLPFIYRDYKNKNRTGMLLNTFYLFSASLGYYRWLYA